MATVREYFEKSFAHALSAEKEMIAVGRDLKLPVRTHIDTDALAIYASVLIADGPDDLILGIAETLLREPRLLATVTVTPNVKMPGSPTHGLRLGFAKLDHKLRVEIGGPDGMSATDEDCTFTNTLYFYIERRVSEAMRDRLFLTARANGIRLGIRDEAYAEHMNLESKPVAFISHDSRDKEQIVRPLVLQLSRVDCPVWYDEFSLKVGDNLRKSIERGLLATRHCILVLTPNFISKESGWPSTELDIVFTREVNEGVDIFLPVWHGVTKEQVMAYSPVLANRVAAQWSKGVELVCNDLLRAIRASKAV